MLILSMYIPKQGKCSLTDLWNNLWHNPISHEQGWHCVWKTHTMPTFCFCWCSSHVDPNDPRSYTTSEEEIVQAGSKLGNKSELFPLENAVFHLVLLQMTRGSRAGEFKNYIVVFLAKWRYTIYIYTFSCMKLSKECQVQRVRGGGEGQCLGVSQLLLNDLSTPCIQLCLSW